MIVKICKSCKEAKESIGMSKKERIERVIIEATECIPEEDMELAPIRQFPDEEMDHRDSLYSHGKLELNPQI